VIAIFVLLGTVIAVRKLSNLGSIGAISSIQ
jgi:hypothetical protein